MNSRVFSLSVNRVAGQLSLIGSFPTSSLRFFGREDSDPLEGFKHSLSKAVTEALLLLVLHLSWFCCDFKLHLSTFRLFPKYFSQDLSLIHYLTLLLCSSLFLSQIKVLPVCDI